MNIFLLKGNMSISCTKKFWLLLFIYSNFLYAQHDILFIRCGYIYQGDGTWSTPGDMWGATSHEFFPVKKEDHKTGFVDMSQFWMIPFLQNFWVPLTLDSSYQHYPYVQTAIPHEKINKLYVSMEKKGISSFVVYPEAPGIRSGDVLEVQFPGTFFLKGLMIFKKEEGYDTSVISLIEKIEHSCSAKEKERIYQWKNHEFPLYFLDTDSLNRPYLLEMYYSEDQINAFSYIIIQNLAEMNRLKQDEPYLIKYQYPENLFKNLHALDKETKIRFLDDLTVSDSEDSSLPNFLFLNANPLSKPAEIKYIMIKGKFFIIK